MRPSNPACYECPKGDGGMHSWKIIDAGAICTNCRVKLNTEQAADCFFDPSAVEQCASGKEPT